MSYLPNYNYAARNGRQAAVLVPDVSSVENKQETITATQDGDNDLFAHIVEAEKIADAIINGTPLEALCGKIWVPSRDPDKFPKCKSCLEIYDQFVAWWDGPV